jgi:hypothetical protein
MSTILPAFIGSRVCRHRSIAAVQKVHGTQCSGSRRGAPQVSGRRRGRRPRSGDTDTLYHMCASMQVHLEVSIVRRT